MVMCTESSSSPTPDCTEKPTIAKKEFYKSKHYRHDAFVYDVNDNKTNWNDSNNNYNDKSTHANRHSIKSFYRNACILVTGGTGFLGKVLLEKLLRSCETLECIYVLLRSKRGLSSEERYRELIQNPVFDRIRESYPERLQKIVFIAGDISKPNIGLSTADLQMLKANVTIVFHSAATVRFDQGIKEAANLNTLGSKRLWDLCSEMKNLKSIIHVSTAYSNPTLRSVGETVYPPKTEMDVETFLKCVDALPENLVQSIANEMQGKHPNTYTITKSMAEQIAVNFHHKLPISIVRPSIEKTNTIRVYNCTSGELNPLIWETCRRKVLKYSRIYPSKYVMMYPNFTYRTNRFVHFFYEVFLHFLPAYLYDIAMRYKGMKPIMMRIAKRYKAAADTGEFFAMHEWNFEVNNVKELISAVNHAEDGHEFVCNVNDLDWDQYLKNYVFGIRKYVLRDELTSMDSARRKVKRLYALKWIVQTIFWCSLLFIFYEIIF